MMKTINLFKHLLPSLRGRTRVGLLMLCLIVAGAQSAWAEWDPSWQYCVYKGEFTSNDIVYYVYQTSYNNRVSSIKQINATGDVVIPYNAHLGGLTTLYSLGWWVDHEQVEDVNCEASMTSLTFESRPQIHGNFTLQNLHGKLNLTGNYFDRVTYTRICSDATLNIPLATSLEFSRAKIEGTINAPSISALNLHEFSIVSGTINAVNATSAKIEGNISGTINIPKVTTAEMRYGTTISGTINADELTNVHIASSTNISGTINALKATEVYMDFVDSFTGTINAPKATTITIRAGEGVKNSMYGTISSSQVTSITLGDVDFGTTGKLDCNHLTDIYIPNNSFVPNFTGPYTNHFTAAAHSITVHVYNMSAKQLAAMKNSSTWSGFKEIINHKSDLNYTIATEGNARVTLYQLNGNDDYAHCTDFSVKCMLLSGSRSGTIKAGGDYAVEVKDVDFPNRKVRLYVNGSEVPLMDGDDQNVQVKYANLQEVQTSQNIKVVISDKICKVLFTQEHLYTTPPVTSYQSPTKHYATVTYRKKLDGETVIGHIDGESAVISCAQGSNFFISAPYDEYEPDTLLLNGNLRGMSYHLGQASQVFTLPTDDNEDEITYTVELRWREIPKPTVIETPEGNTVNLDEHHQPQFVVMRSGEGEVVLKGMAHPEHQHSIDNYEQDFNCTAQNGWVVSKEVNCSQAITSVTVPDYDLYYGDELDPEAWGFVLEMTPLAGQTIRSLTLGWTDHDGDLIWEDMLQGDFASYTTLDTSTNKYTMNVAGDYMNFDIRDYFINVALGPAETAVETGKTLNFVRKGGRGQAWIYWHDTDYDHYFNEDGSSSVFIPYEQLADIEMNVELNEGETMHVYKNSEDITDQFQQRETPTDLWAPLEEESATYTLIIEESPDVNPMWTVLQSGEMTGTQVVVTRNGEDEISTIGAATTMTIDDVGVEKVTLKVPVGHLEDVVQYKVMLDAVENETTVRIYLQNTLGLGRFAVSDLFNSLPALIPIDAFDTEEEAQAIVDALTSKGATAHTVSGTYGATQAVGDNVPIKVFRNGWDMTFEMTYGDPLYATYEVPVDVLIDATWEVNFDTSHRQTIYRKGGTGEVEMAYGYMSRDINVPLSEGFTTIDLPGYNYDAGNRYVEFSIEYVEGEKVKVYRNGEDVTRVFGAPQTLQGKQYYYISDESTPNTQNAYGFILRDAATWEVVIEESHKMLNAYANNDVIVEYIKMVDGEQQSVSGQANAMHKWVNEGETYVVRFTPQHGEELTRFDIGWDPIDIGQDSRLVRNDDGSYSFTLYYGDMNEKTFNIMAVFSGGTNDENAVEYMFIGDYVQVYASADLNDDVQYDGYEFVKQNVSGFYINKIVENGMAANQSATVEFQLPDANATGRVFRNGVDVTDQFTHYGDYYYPKEEFRSVMHEPAHWVIINESELMKYDVNRDNSINISDVTKLVNKILEKPQE